MISPLVKSSIQPENQISCFDVNSTAIKSISTEYPSIQIGNSISDTIQNSDLIILAVKPQNVYKVYEEMNNNTKKNKNVNVRKDATILSIIAGKPISSFVKGTGIQKVARSMPNTPAQIGQGVTVWSCTSNIELEERERIDQVLRSLGKS